MKYLKKDSAFYAFSPDLPPALKIEAGEAVVMETNDCIGGQIKSEADSMANVDLNRINPVSGPVYIEGAERGDTLAVDIHEINVKDRGIMLAIPGSGTLGDLITVAKTRIIPIRQGRVEFNEKVSLPLKPMIGVIGTAPENGAVPAGVPGEHGGNMDCKIIAAGSRVYLPVNCPGALLGMGDLHGVMGDGEAVTTALEVAGEVTFSVNIIKGRPFPLPFVETDHRVAAIYSALTSDEAVRGAVRHMAKYLTDYLGLGINEVGMLMSIAGNLTFCQVVNPLQTVRMEFPREILRSYGKPE